MPVRAGWMLVAAALAGCASAAPGGDPRDTPGRESPDRGWGRAGVDALECAERTMEQIGYEAELHPRRREVLGVRRTSDSRGPAVRQMLSARLLPETRGGNRLLVRWFERLIPAVDTRRDTGAPRPASRGTSSGAQDVEQVLISCTRR